MARPDRRWLAGLAVLCVSAPAAAGDWSEQFSQAVELPSHRWLAETRQAPDTTLAPFETDGCSGGMSSLWSYMAERYPDFSDAHGGVPPWEACCVTHDRAYHDAGPDPAPDASYAARLAADTLLQSCVAATSDVEDEVLISQYGFSEPQVRAAYAAIGEAMFQAVRLGGGPCTGLPWRWGYGYPQCWDGIVQ